MASFRRVLTVFLASPSDLGDERHAAKGVVDELVPIARELGISLELLGWEDTLPGAQRPQDIINKDLDQADLFVGMLWRRWGQPTGRYTSGFDEEFKRARARWKTSGAPDIWLFFKDVDAAQRADAGEQLQKVLEFEARCIAENSPFFKRFETTEDWASLFRNNLLLLLARGAKNEANEPERQRAQTSRPHSKKTTPKHTRDAAAPSLLPLAYVLSDIADGGNPQEHATAHGGMNSARLYLLGLSLLAESDTSADLAGTHEANTLYRLRRAFEPIPIEQALLARTVLADRSSLKPGWYWFPQEEEAQGNAIVSYALFDSDVNVRIGALAVLTAGRMWRPEWSSVFFSADRAESQPAGVRAAFWAYLEAIVSPSDRDRLEAMLSAVAAKEPVLNLLRIARVATEPGAVLGEAATTPEGPHPRLIAELKRNMAAINPTVLVAAFSSRHDAIRIAIANELARRGAFHDIRTAAEADALEEIRVLAYRDRLQSAIAASHDRPEVPEGLSLDVARTLRMERVRGLPREELEQRIQWLNVEGPAAYETLATEHWPIVANRVRTDAANHFEGIRQAWLDRSSTEALDTVNIDGIAHDVLNTMREKVKERLEAHVRDDLTRFIRHSLGAAALAAIEKHGTSEDAPFVRQFLDSTVARDMAVRAIGRVGDESDVPKLLEIVNERYGETKRLAARQALRLTRDRRGVLSALSQTSDADIVRLALSEMIEFCDGTARSAAVELLRHGVASVRQVAAEVLASILDSTELTEVLNSYILHGTYYYNVAVAIDRALYCRVQFPTASFEFNPWSAML